MDFTKDDRRPVRLLLARWGDVPAYCARRQKEIADFRELMESAAELRPRRLDGMPSGKKAQSAVEYAAERLQELQERYREHVKALAGEIERELAFSRAMDESMAAFTETERTVLDYKYKREKRYVDIARLIHYSEAQVRNIERDAVDKLMGLVEITRGTLC